MSDMKAKKQSGYPKVYVFSGRPENANDKFGYENNYLYTPVVRTSYKLDVRLVLLAY